MEAEMIAACESCCQIKWIINLLPELEEWNFMEKPTAIYTDSQSLINWISSPKQSSRCRHINRKYHFLRDCYESRDICLLYKPSQDLEADIFTKVLSRDQMKKHLENLSIVGIKTKISSQISRQQLLHHIKVDRILQGSPDHSSSHPKVDRMTTTNRALRAHERNYTVSELECLAIVESVDKFRIYLTASTNTASTFNIDTNGLHTITRNGVTKIIIPKTLQYTLMNKVHQEYNHPGISQMTRIITTQYYWKGISKSIEKFVRSCHTCQIIKRPRGKPYGALGQIPPPQQPFDLISIDTIAGFSKYGHSKTYLHVIVDHLTRYAWTFPSQSISTLTYIQTLKTVLQQGFPKRLLSDRAPAFTSEKFRKFLITHGIQPLLTTSNNPQANGLIERLNATITGKLRLAYLENPKASWTQLVKRVTQTFNLQKLSTSRLPTIGPNRGRDSERYLVVSGMKKKEEADKIDLFMYLMGDRADDIFRTFKFEKEEEATKIDSVLKVLKAFRKNIIYERVKFNSRIQEDREPVDEFITSLYKLADSCEFEGLHEQLIRDRIVAVKMVRQQEAVRQQQVDLQRPSTSQKVNQVKFNSKKQSPKQQQQPSRKKEKSAKTRSRCPKCGGFTHREGQACRAEGQRYNLCSKNGHFANCCPDKQAKTAEVEAVYELDEEIGFLLEVSAVEDSSNLDDDEGECRRRWTAEIQVNGKQVKFKLDSQAGVTCVPLCLFKKIMGQQRLVESDINIRELRNSPNFRLWETIYVIRRLSEPLLSRRACELLNLARRIEVVTRINPIKEFPEVFEELGQIGNPYEIKVKPGAKPYAVHTPRRVPIPLMEKLKTRLDIPGKELLDADALSRQPLLTTEGGENERQTSAHINAVLSSITDKDEMLTKIFEAQQEDTTLKAALLSYWHVKDELGVQKGLLMRSCRLVIPASMKLEILDKLHAGHFGITKTRLRARETVWWPGISEGIAETVRKCSVCVQEVVSKHEPLIPTNFPTRPWQKIGMDLFKFENKWYLVFIDYYSRFPEMIQLDRITANVVVRSCKSIFARHGIPETVVSDNGMQFGAAREFSNFAMQYGFTHVTSSPRFPQSNGMAEAGVKIAKLILKKNQDPSLGLPEYRSTPLENGYSPAELLMGHPEKKGGEKEKVYEIQLGLYVETGSIYEKEIQSKIQPTHRRRPFRGRNWLKMKRPQLWIYPSNDSEDGKIRTRTTKSLWLAHRHAGVWLGTDRVKSTTIGHPLWDMWLDHKEVASEIILDGESWDMFRLSGVLARMSLDVTGVFFTRHQLSAWKSGVINCLGFWAKSGLDTTYSAIYEEYIDNMSEEMVMVWSLRSTGINLELSTIREQVFQIKWGEASPMVKRRAVANDPTQGKLPFFFTGSVKEKLEKVSKEKGKKRKKQDKENASRSGGTKKNASRPGTKENASRSGGTKENGSRSSTKENALRSGGTEENAKVQKPAQDRTKPLGEHNPPTTAPQNVESSSEKVHPDSGFLSELDLSQEIAKTSGKVNDGLILFEPALNFSPIKRKPIRTYDREGRRKFRESLEAAGVFKKTNKGAEAVQNSDKPAEAAALQKPKALSKKNKKYQTRAGGKGSKDLAVEVSSQGGRKLERSGKQRLDG
ncbi:K02A2.6-like [Cordylochernes scorpioides]|uniref:RNA-directed DNA polymerase n=1 Tax=Cordylochernes scorpioides TaxID=51811 RepID=A0ABY6K7I3_9ARAC|nr:K02A2.6-like [Cordylochernes scorpioides]